MRKGCCEGRQIGACLPISVKMPESSHCVPCVVQHHSSAKGGVFPCLLYYRVRRLALPSASPIFPLHSPPPFLLMSSLPPSPIHGHCRSLQVNCTHPTSKLSALKVYYMVFHVHCKTYTDST